MASRNRYLADTVANLERLASGQSSAKEARQTARVNFAKTKQKQKGDVARAFDTSKEERRRDEILQELKKLKRRKDEAVGGEQKKLERQYNELNKEAAELRKEIDRIKKTQREMKKTTEKEKPTPKDTVLAPGPSIRKKRSRIVDEQDFDVDQDMGTGPEITLPQQAIATRETIQAGEKRTVRSKKVKLTQKQTVSEIPAPKSTCSTAGKYLQKSKSQTGPYTKPAARRLAICRWKN